MGKKRKKHQWQIDLEKEQERLRNRPKLTFTSRKANDVLDFAHCLGIPAAIIAIGGVNYSSARLDLESHLKLIQKYHGNGG